MPLGPEYIHGLSVALGKILPCRVSRVEGGESWIALRVSSSDEQWLLLSWGNGSAGCCKSDESSIEFLKKNARARPPLVEALKSRLVKGRILAARQLNYDRVIEFEFSRLVAAGFEVAYSLVLEATEPTGNLILLNGERKIEELARHASPDVNRYRTLLPAHAYAPPPNFDGLILSEVQEIDFESVSKIKGIGRPLARLIQSQWDERAHSQWLSALKSLYAEDGGAKLYCQRTEKGYLTRFPLPLAKLSQIGDDALEGAREGVLQPLLKSARAHILRDLDVRALRAAKAKERRIDGLLKQLDNHKVAETFRLKGQLLLANITKNQPNNNACNTDNISLNDWTSGENINITLDPRLSISKNADRYFKKYKKAHCDPDKINEEISSLKSAIDEIREQRDLLDSIENLTAFDEAARDVEEWLTGEVEKRAAAKDTKKGGGKKSSPLPPHLRFDMDEYIILVGLSARGNRYVTFKQAAGDDIWLHAHEVSGAHVIIKGARGRENLDEKVLLFAASLAATHSAKSGDSFTQVDYTERRHVRAVPGTVSLVLYTNPSTIRVNPANDHAIPPSHSS
ncbi:fibronectin-binding protein A [Synergistales bacterium]|nr:fibronectin-binding protein A [Synergistales bacterium]